MIRWVRALLCALALTLIAAGTAVADGGSVAKDEYCDFQAVRDAAIHSRAGERYPVIGHLSAGEIVSALRRPINGFHLLGRGGYVASAHLELIEEPARCGS